MSARYMSACKTCGGTGKKMRYSDRDQYHDPCPDCAPGDPEPEDAA